MIGRLRARKMNETVAWMRRILKGRMNQLASHSLYQLRDVAWRKTTDHLMASDMQPAPAIYEKDMRRQNTTIDPDLPFNVTTGSVFLSNLPTGYAFTYDLTSTLSNLLNIGVSRVSVSRVMPIADSSTIFRTAMDVSSRIPTITPPPPVSQDHGHLRYVLRLTQPLARQLSRAQALSRPYPPSLTFVTFAV
ncbi:hypothetical protein AAF712_011929 [Marasmius tenuissimus]|uniref:Uncharacterized protein n=1 Tax=Marasmius tenuissimus TaxID=585030 RepID=A0ABR2ZI63_9AGAR